ncbi:MAG: HEAT repeat domain-containing protein [Candidatus Omnitrophica bacterium]|nr:HEAT repeat domain-containing protein [Candidatus Omnitrophota bacterium]
MANKRVIKVFLISLSVFLLNGCVAALYKPVDISTLKYEKPFEKSRIFEVPLDTLWPEVIQTINAGGKEIVSISKERDYGFICVNESITPQRLNEIAIVPPGIGSWDYLYAVIALQIKAKDEQHTEVMVETEKIYGFGWRWWERYLSFWPLPWSIFAKGAYVEMGSKGVIEKEYLESTCSLIPIGKTYAWLKEEVKPEELIEQLKDKDAKRRQRAVLKLGKLGDTQAIKYLIICLNDKDSRVRREAVLALSKMGEPVLESMITCLDDDNIYIRANAALVLGNLGNSSAVESLIPLLEDEAPLVRKNTACALAKIGDSQAVEPLITALKDEDSKVRIESAYALGQIGDNRALKPLVSALEDEKSAVRKKVIISALSEFGKPALEPIIGCLKEEDWNVRNYTAGILGEFKEPRAVEALIEIMERECNFILSNKDRLLISEVDLKNPAKLKEFEKVSGRHAVIWSAAITLSRIGELAVEPLVVCLSDERTELQAAAARALGEIKDRRAVGPLIECLRKKQKRKRGSITLYNLHYEAKDALRKITNEDFGESYSRWQKWWKRENEKGNNQR